MEIHPPSSASGLKLRQECKHIALVSVAKGQGRAREICKAVLSYIFSNPTKCKPFGATALVKVAFEDPKHPSRKFRPFSPEIEKSQNNSIIDRLIDSIPMMM